MINVWIVYLISISIYLFYIHSDSLLSCIEAEFSVGHNIKEAFILVSLLGLSEAMPKVNQYEPFKVDFKRNEFYKPNTFSPWFSKILNSSVKHISLPFSTMPSNMCALRTDTREKKSLNRWLKFNWAFLVVQRVRNLYVVQETPVRSLCSEDLEMGTATHSSILFWRIPWTKFNYTGNACSEQVHMIKLHKKWLSFLTKSN